MQSNNDQFKGMPYSVRFCVGYAYGDDPVGASPFDVIHWFENTGFPWIPSQMLLTCTSELLSYIGKDVHLYLE